MSRLDLRVHYGASSTLADDLKYQAQAESYIQATTNGRIPLCRPEASQEILVDSRPVLTRSKRLSQETRTAVRELNSQLLLIRRLAPCTPTAEKLQARLNPPAHSTRSASKTSSSSRSIATSHLVTPVLNSVVKRRRHVPTSQSPTAVLTDRIVARKTLAAASPEVRDENDGQTRSKFASHGSERPSTDRATSQMPSSYSLSDIGPLFDTSALNSGVQTTSNEQIPRRLDQTSSGRKGATSQPPGLPVSQTSPQQSLKLIMPPVPAVGLSHFSTHVTEKLRLLVADASLAKRYSPSSIKRAIDKSERGHWSLDIQAWPESLQISSWQFLKDFIGCGSAGFGITCSMVSQADDGQGTQIKIFCWGEIVSHTYLLLYVASQRKLETTLASWIDAGGEVIMQVQPSREIIHSRKRKTRSK